MIKADESLAELIDNGDIVVERLPEAQALRYERASMRAGE
jgi:hypothetical protein